MNVMVKEFAKSCSTKEKIDVKYLTNLHHTTAGVSAILSAIKWSLFHGTILGGVSSFVYRIILCQHCGSAEG